MKQRILKNVLVACLICLISSCRFDWDAHPYVAALGETCESSYWTDGKGDKIPFFSPRVSEFINFHYENIAELKAEIDRVNNNIPEGESWEDRYHLHKETLSNEMALLRPDLTPNLNIYQ